ncbi:MAG: CNNM domain-containing protein, partial [Oscillospiraceae bacterium]|nr:CNNM domain-containing protein [Oscillospiraceae bacterium]
KARGRWAGQVFFFAGARSAVLSLASDQALNGAGLAVAFTVLLAFILLGIFFDIIGVAVTAADEKPFHSMAARKTPGAREALNLIRKADKVSSFCNDVGGDICGIISGSTGAVIVVQLQTAMDFLPALVISLAVTALTSGLTIGGKALGKSFAIARSTAVLQLVGRFLHLFSRNKKR